MGKMYFPDEVPSHRDSHTDQLRELEREKRKLEREKRKLQREERKLQREERELQRELAKAKKELTKAILIWIGVIVLVIIDIILFTQFL